MIRAVDISSYHARAALEHHGDNTMIRHLISSAIRKPQEGPMTTKLIRAYHGCINSYHIDIMSEKFLSGRYPLIPVSDRITKNIIKSVLYRTLYQKWGNTGPEMGENGPVSGGAPTTGAAGRREGPERVFWEAVGLDRRGALSSDGVGG